MNQRCLYELRRKSKMRECSKLYNIDENTVIRINTKSGYIEVPYLHLLTQPPEMTVKRDWERWVRKIIRIAAENGGWKLIRKESTCNDNQRIFT